MVMLESLYKDTYEYKKEIILNREVIEKLNELGNEGWECIYVEKKDDCRKLYLFKRGKQNDKRTN